MGADIAASSEWMNLLHRFRSARVWVAGDVMLDEYLEGDVARISPEAPVQVVKVGRSFHRLGGAANVAHLMRVLGAQVSLAGLVGADAAGEQLLAASVAAGLDVRAVRAIPGRPTTRKLRVLSQNQQLLRMDWESDAPIDAPTADSVLAALGASGAPDAIVISDYAKGFLTDVMLRALIEAGRSAGVPVLVDPKRKDFRAYRGASWVTPNLRELRDAIDGNPASTSPDDLANAVRPVIERCELTGVIVTLGEQGMLVVPGSGEPQLLEATGREVYDVTGAGDAVIGVLALGLGSGGDVLTAARLANVAAGIVVGKVGTAVVEPAELARAISSSTADKIFSRPALRAQVEWWRLQGKRVVFTNGCFDLLHVGHLTLLRQAAALGDVLIVGINSDASVGRLKGPTRPLIPEHERAVMLAALDCVNAVVVFEEDTPLELLHEVRPDVLVKGGDYRADQVVGRDLVEGRGGRVALVPLVPERSTSALVNRIRSA